MIHPIVIGTAGHIDHGKTSLVRVLTGIDTDRLAVEKQRGITTELGFAKLDLGDRKVAVVDVPGHERFVKSMVAGATGLDLVMLVIAADEGVMPQTREHLDICDLLGVRRGLIVLTKRDLVDDDWIGMVSTDIRTAVAGTFLDGAPIVPVSTKTGAGIPELRDTLSTIIAALPPRENTGVFRLPVDRVFTVKGFGTIVTGTILGGEVKNGDELTVIPTGLTTRVRGIEVQGAAADRAVAGHRAALNLGGIAVEDLARGDLLAHPDKVAASHILDVELRYLRSAPGPLPARSKVLVHHGTTQLMASLVLVAPGGRSESGNLHSGPKEIAPGTTALAQLRLDQNTPLGALPDDHFIVRGFVASTSGGSTIGGGRVIRVLAPKARKGEEHAATVAALAAARIDQSLGQRVALDIKSSAAAGLTVADIVRRLGVPASSLAAPLATLVGSGELLATGEDEQTLYIHANAVADIEQKIGKLVGAQADGVPREELRTQLPAALSARTYDAILAGLERKKLVASEGDRVRKSAAPKTASLSPTETTILAKLDATGVEPPRPKELPAAVGLAEPVVKTALDKLVASKLAVRIKSDLVMSAKTVDAIRGKLLAFLDEHKTIDAQQWKDLTGASRKFTIPLAEYFDAEKLTLRVGDVRRRR